MRRFLLPLALLAVHTPQHAAPEFHPPSVVRQVEALGASEDFTEIERILFLDTEEFATIPPPGPHDWLASHHERGQTVTQYLAENYPAPASDAYLYLQPIGSNQLPEDFQKLLMSYCSVFFDTEVKLLPTIPIDPKTIRSRANRFTGNNQLNASDILSVLASKKPSDAYAIIAFTTVDLYPSEAWNFVFGLANLREGVGVFSFARYGDLSHQKQRYTERALKVMTHEIAHMYGLKHCVYYHCLLNGSNNLTETDNAPMHLCPVCLRKLDLASRPDHLTRYARLKKIYTEQQLDRPATYAKKRIQKLLTPPNSKP